MGYSKVGTVSVPYIFSTRRRNAHATGTCTGCRFLPGRNDGFVGVIGQGMTLSTHYYTHEMLSKNGPGRIVLGASGIFVREACISEAFAQPQEYNFVWSRRQPGGRSDSFYTSVTVNTRIWVGRCYLRGCEQLLRGTCRRNLNTKLGNGFGESQALGLVHFLADVVTCVARLALHLTQERVLTWIR